MPVRIKLRIKTGCKEFVTSAFVNSGYESSEPELLIPVRLAAELGLWKNVREDYARSPVGVGKVYTVDEKLEVEAVAEDRTSEAVKTKVVISEFEDEVLIGDYLSSELKIAVEDFREGLWRFKDEPLSKLRKSEKPQYWR
jgi:hypothetical protein